MKNILKGILVIFIYFFISLFQAEIIAAFGIDITLLSTNLKLLILTIFQILTIFLIIYLLKEDLKKQFNDIKKNHKIYFKKYFKYWFLLLILSGLSNIIISFFHKDIATNENLIREQFKIAPIYIYISAVFFAPIIEELIFRLSINKIVSKPKWLYIFISGIVFGGLHVFPVSSSFIELLYIIPYSIPGFIFAYLFTKEKNIFVPMGIHFIHNGILMSLQFLILMFG